MTERNAYYDVLRGIAIIGVVAIHSNGAGLKFPDDTLNFNVSVLWRQMMNFAVPLFIVISGFFLAKKDLTTPDKYFSFIKSQTAKVYFPCIFWSMLWFAVMVILWHKPVANELIKVFTFRSSDPYYFIALIVQFYLLCPLLKKLANKTGLAISFLISLCSILAIFYIRYFLDIDLPVLLYAGFFTIWMVFFVYGLYLGSRRINFLSNPVLILIIIFCYALSCAETYWLYHSFGQPKDAVTAIKVSSFLYSLSIITFAFKNVGRFSSRILEKIGLASFGIYLIHMFVIFVGTKILTFIPAIMNVQLLYQSLLVAFTIAVCMFIIYVTNKILSRPLIKFIGF